MLVDGHDVLGAISVVVVLMVASIPIAMQVVTTSTMAAGSSRLAKKKVIVARLSAIEELAGMTILCSDKTGTLTLNKLSLRDPIPMADMDKDELIFHGALAAVEDESSQDAIDFCICNAVTERARLAEFKVLKYFPFNPTDKRTEATLERQDGTVFKVTKGAPQVVLRMSHNKGEIKDRVEASVQELADRGFRALGLAVSYTGVGEEEKWEFQGILSLFDPPRADTKETIRKALENGVEVKMITGDQTAIAKETCRELGMGTNILHTEALIHPHANGVTSIDETVLNANGFAEVLPEHKFEIVDRLRKMGLVVGMTGDGVNDAPALKRAGIGIAVEGATDAAKAAADIVLIEAGLSVVIDAIMRSRKIFQRMRNYSIYRVAGTIQLLFFFFFAVITVKPHHFFGDGEEVESSFTLPVIALVIITILNDGTIIGIGYDHVVPHNKPQKWDLTEVAIVATVLGLTACLGSLVLLVLAMEGGGLTNTDFFFVDFIARYPEQGIRFGEIMTMMYLKISISDFLTVFSARTTRFFWERRPGRALILASLLATGLSTIIAALWPFGEADGDVPLEPLDGSYAMVTVWVYCLIWFVLGGVLKVMTYRILAKVRPNSGDIKVGYQTQPTLHPLSTHALDQHNLGRRLSQSSIRRLSIDSTTSEAAAAAAAATRMARRGSSDSTSSAGKRPTAGKEGNVHVPETIHSQVALV